MANTKQGLSAYRTRERSISSINSVGITSPSHYIEMPHTQTSTSSAAKLHFALLLYGERVWGCHTQLQHQIYHCEEKRMSRLFFIPCEVCKGITLNIWRCLNQPQQISKQLFEKMIAVVLVIFWNGNIVGLNCSKDKVHQNKSCFFIHAKSWTISSEVKMRTRFHIPALIHSIENGTIIA